MNAGFLYHDFPLTLATGQRRKRGALFYTEAKDCRKPSPFPRFSHITRISELILRSVIFFTRGTFDRYGSEYRWHFFQLFTFAGGENQDQEKARRSPCFPFIFSSARHESEQNYTALVPFYGRFKGRLFRDEIFFGHVPSVRAKLKAGRDHHNYLFPFFHLRQGNGLRGWQFWPLPARSTRKSPAHKWFWRFSSFPDTTSPSVLAALTSDRNPGIGLTTQQHKHAILPLYSLLRSPTGIRHHRLALFIWVDYREKKYSRVAAALAFCRLRPRARAKPQLASGRSSARLTTPSWKAASSSGRFTNTIASIPKAARSRAHAYLSCFSSSYWTQKNSGNRATQQTD